MTRREQIADAGIRLIARNGVRAMTHLAVDEEAGLPRGSTSYYARTRRALTTLVVNRLAEGTQMDLDRLAIPATLTSAEAVQLATGFVDYLARREEAQATRFALLFELRDDVELRALLTADAPVRAVLMEKAAVLLQAMGMADPARHAPDLVGLLDALLMYRVARAAPMDNTAVLRAYFAGLAAGGSPSSEGSA